MCGGLFQKLEFLGIKKNVVYEVRGRDEGKAEGWG